MPSGNPYVHTDLVPSYGTVPKSTTENSIDDKLQAIIASTLHNLEKKALDDCGWHAVVSEMMQNNQLEPGLDSEVHRVGTYTNTGLSNLGSFTKQGETTKHILQFLNSLIGDPDVIHCTKIDFDQAVSGIAHVDVNVPGDGMENQSASKVDIGALRDPSVQRPHFKIYRIKIAARIEHESASLPQRYNNSVAVEYDARIFQLRKEIHASLVKEVPQEIAAALFGI